MAYYRWDQEEARLAVALRNTGLTYREIAACLNEEFDRDRSRNKVSDAFCRGLIDAVLEGDSTTGEQRSDRYKLTLTSDGATKVEANRPYSDEEMAEMFDVDMAQWRITKRITNVYGNNFHTKLWWEPNFLEMLTPNWDGLLEEVAARSKPELRLPETGEIMGELALYDAHLGAKGWGPETGEDYDLYIGLARYRTAFMELVERSVRAEDISRWLFVVGQDLFHFDTLIQGKGGATQKGTPQDVDTRWQKLFVAVYDMMVECISHALEFANMDIIVQPGNHDTQTTFYLGAALGAYFHADNRVRVDNTPKPRKYKAWGQVGLGFCHGNEEKASALYKLMTEEAGFTMRWREWHRGHLHQELCSEDGTMRIRGFPALAGGDAWHVGKGYRSLPGARACLWDMDQGLLQIVCHNVPVAEARTDNMGEVLTD